MSIKYWTKADTVVMPPSSRMILLSEPWGISTELVKRQKAVVSLGLLQVATMLEQQVGLEK